MNRTKHNWPAIEAEYIAGSCSLQDLASRYGIALSNVKDRAGRGDWTGKRALHRTALAEAAKEAAAGAALLGKAEIDSLASQCIDLLLAALAINLGQVVLHAASFDMQDANHAMAAVQKAVEAKYRILGIPLPAQQIKHSGSVEVQESNKDAIRQRLLSSGLTEEMLNAILNRKSPSA